MGKPIPSTMIKTTATGNSFGRTGGEDNERVVMRDSDTYSLFLGVTSLTGSDLLWQRALATHGVHSDMGRAISATVKECARFRGSFCVIIPRNRFQTVILKIINCFDIFTLISLI